MKNIDPTSINRDAGLTKIKVPESFRIASLIQQNESLLKSVISEEAYEVLKTRLSQRSYTYAKKFIDAFKAKHQL